MGTEHRECVPTCEDTPDRSPVNTLPAPLLGAAALALLAAVVAVTLAVRARRREHAAHALFPAQVPVAQLRKDDVVAYAGGIVVTQPARLNPDGWVSIIALPSHPAGSRRLIRLDFPLAAQVTVTHRPGRFA